MPHLRFTRDRRGYEHIALVQDSRRRGRDRARILYVFRTPPGVRIGREAFDPDTLDLIERANPDVVFDWNAILDARPAVPEDEEPMRPARTRRQPPVPGGSFPATDRRQSAAAAVPVLDRVLGRDAAMRLRQRFAAMRSRLDEGTSIDEPQLARCRTRLAGLDPDSWTGEEAVRSRSAEFDAAIEEIRRTLGLPRRRSRRAGRRDDSSDAAGEHPAVSAVPANDTNAAAPSVAPADRPELGRTELPLRPAEAPGSSEPPSTDQ